MSYEPSGWLPNAHAMTVYGRLVRRVRPLSVARERWELPDGDFLDVDGLEPRGHHGPLLVVCHGLEGSSTASYVRGLMSAAADRGFGTRALNFRGCSGEPNRLARSYHSGETGDLSFAIDRLSREAPDRPLFLVGFSLGGNVVAKYLGESGDGAHAAVQGAAVISVPFDLAACARTLDGPGLPARLYRERFLRSLRAKARAKASLLPSAFDLQGALDSQTFAEFDDRFTAPLHGFAGADDYWRRSSSGPLLESVRRPLLAIMACDDPFIPSDSIPSAVQNAFVHLEVTPQGGHQGFISGPPWRPERWAEKQALEFLNRILTVV